MASRTSSAISLTKTIIGAGLLSMPLAFSTDGIVVGVIIIFVAALTSGYGLFLQAYVSRYTAPGHATFFALSSLTYKSLSVVFDLAIAIQCFGCAISYLVLVGDIMPTILGSPFWSPKVFWIMASTLVCVPLSFLRNLDSLKYSSILGLAAIAYMSLLVIFHFFLGDAYVPGERHLAPQSAWGVFSTFSIIVFAFTGHQNMFSIINEASDRSLHGLTSLVASAILASSGLFVAVGLAGYLTFGDSVSGNIILSYSHSWSATFGKLCIVFMVLFSFPLMLHPARISVNNIYQWLVRREEEAEIDDETPLLESQSRSPPIEKTFVPLTVILLVVGYILAVSVKSFALVLAVVGATGSTAISFILPGLFGYKLIGSESDNPTRYETWLRALSALLVVWGVAVMVVCLYVSLS
ncbi:Vacuolar amino acid transporter 7 [Meyerozyma sp. JA9]|nr:Vacuolar amino acid transporter 7 [Meyerozyma sp. JA9]